MIYDLCPKGRRNEVQDRCKFVSTCTSPLNLKLLCRQSNHEVKARASNLRSLTFLGRHPRHECSRHELNVQHWPLYSRVGIICHFGDWWHPKDHVRNAADLTRFLPHLHPEQQVKVYLRFGSLEYPKWQIRAEHFSDTAQRAVVQMYIPGLEQMPAYEWITGRPVMQWSQEEGSFIDVPASEIGSMVLQHGHGHGKAFRLLQTLRSSFASHDPEKETPHDE
ncbi:hypothetical protein DOTSEDRAFT_28528 [Dothistroma septosporum NZE10]|uniref:Uncharacterized protein n=1 Tax=Dothistroma septosporum (strain NZE10 / CBS 128990) TaxID=675120 RepID=M2XIT8_DOTSN|nr:hypothetical protein DOTSEDRAFT_28528 [Dothistroma septosporum NZE10]